MASKTRTGELFAFIERVLARHPDHERNTRTLGRVRKAGKFLNRWK